MDLGLKCLQQFNNGRSRPRVQPVRIFNFHKAPDLHDFFLGEHYGWERLSGMKRQKLKPLRRSSKMGKAEFSEHIEFIARYMSELGIVLELPGE